MVVATGPRRGCRGNNGRLCQRLGALRHGCGALPTWIFGPSVVWNSSGVCAIGCLIISSSACLPSCEAKPHESEGKKCAKPNQTVSRTDSRIVRRSGGRAEALDSMRWSRTQAPAQRGCAREGGCLQDAVGYVGRRDMDDVCEAHSASDELRAGELQFCTQ